MSQMLNIRILNNGKPVALAFNRWGAYTVKACRMAQRIMDEIDTIPSGETDVDLTLALLMSSLSRAGGCLDSTDANKAVYERCATKYPMAVYGTEIGRPDGKFDFCFHVDPDDIEDDMGCYNGLIDIDLTDLTVCVDVWKQWTPDEWSEDIKCKEFRDQYKRVVKCDRFDLLKPSSFEFFPRILGFVEGWAAMSTNMDGKYSSGTVLCEDGIRIGIID